MAAKTPRDRAISLVSCEAWVLEERNQIIRDCGVGIPNYGGEIEALDRAFVFGAEIAFGLMAAEAAERNEE